MLTARAADNSQLLSNCLFERIGRLSLWPSMRRRQGNSSGSRAIRRFNASTIGAEIQLPFGGTKGTGNGHREAGTAALDIFTEWKSVYVDYSGKLQKAQIED
jgi:hypothetical protein